MEVVRGILLVRAVGLVCPVDSDFLGEGQCKATGYVELETNRLVNSAAIQGLHGPFSSAGVVKLNKTIVMALGGKLSLDWKELLIHIF